MSIRTITISMLLVGLFLIAMVNFGHFLAIDSGLNSTVLNTSLGSIVTDAESQINAESSTSNSSLSSFEQGSLNEDSDNIVIAAIKGVGTTFSGTTKAMYNIVVKVPSEILGVPAIVLTTLNIILTISIALLAWRLYRSGS